MEHVTVMTWKDFKQTRAYGKAKLFLKRAVGKEMRLRVEATFPVVEYGGWLLSPGHLPRGGLVYSLGVGDDVRFDLALIERFGVEVHAFDPTPSSIDMLNEQPLPAGFHFHPWAITGHDGTVTLYPRGRRNGRRSDTMYTMVPDAAAVICPGLVVPALSLPTVLGKLCHTCVDLLKVDIEGAEYDVLETLLASPVKPTQLLVEFHHRFASFDQSMTKRSLCSLREIGYRIFAVSETGREVSLIRLSA